MIACDICGCQGGDAVEDPCVERFAVVIRPEPHSDFPVRGAAVYDLCRGCRDRFAPLLRAAIAAQIVWIRQETAA